MQLTRITLTNWLAHNHLDLELTPLTVVAGPNASGKSSIAEAVAFGMTGDLRRVSAKSDRSQLVSDGTEKGTVTVEFEGVQVQRDIGTAKIKAGGRLPVPPDAITDAVPYLLDCRRFAAEGADERSKLLRTLMGAEMGQAAIKKALIERKHPAALVDQLQTTESIDDWTKNATKRAAEGRGAWKVLTGQAYGTQKAAGFSVEAPGPSVADMDELIAAEQASQLAVQDLQHQAGALDASLAHQASHAARTMALTAEAAALPALTDELHEAERILAELQEQAARARNIGDAMRAKVAPATLTCPCCQAALVLDDGKLAQAQVVTRQPKAEDLAANASTQAGLAERTRTQSRYRAELAEAVRRASAAADVLAAIGPAPATAAGDRADVKTRLEAAQATLATTAAAAQDARQAAAGIARALQATHDAAAQHRLVMGWTAIGEALAPDGIPAEILGRVIGPFNSLLRDYAAQTGWKQPAIGRDMGIRADGRPYALLSRSEKWRVDAMVTCAIAACSDLAFVVIDELDLLDVASRPRAMGWLHALTQSGQLDTALLLGTLKAAPAAPPDVSVVWLGDPAPMLEQAA